MKKMSSGKKAQAPAPIRHIVSIGIALGGLTFALFARTCHYPFINFDDPAYILERPQITAGITAGGIRWILTHPHGGNWHPLTSFSHMIDCQFFGQNAGAHHFVSVLLHVMAAVALFFALVRGTGAVWRSGIVAAIFAWHPLRVESVAWVAERKDVLSGLFFALTLGAYFRYARGRGSYWLVVLLLGLGLMAKPMLVTVPLLLLALDYWPLRRLTRTAFTRLLIEKLPLLLLALGSVFATLWAQHDAVRSLEQLSLGSRFANALSSYVVYLAKFLWPCRLAVFYPYSALPLWQTVSAAVLLASVTALALAWSRTRPYFLAGWLWFLGMLVPVIGLVQVGLQSHADRYSYLPEIGLAIALVWSIAEASANFAKPTMAALTVAGLLALSACTWQQLSVWRDSETLWHHAIAVTSDNDVAHANLADLFIRENRAADALAEAQEAVRLSPKNRDAQNDLALAFFRQGQLRAAARHWELSLGQNRGGLNAQTNYAWLLATATDATLRDGTRAVALAQDVLQRSGGDNPATLRAAGAAYAESGEFEKAIATAQEALAIARAQKNAAMVEDLQLNIASYRRGIPLRDPGLFVR